MRDPHAGGVPEAGELEDDADARALAHVERLRRRQSNIERALRDRKAGRAALLDASLARTQILRPELERRAVFGSEDAKSRFVYDVATEHRQVLGNLLERRQAEFEKTREASAYVLARLQGQQANASHILRTFRKERDGAFGKDEDDDDGTDSDAGADSGSGSASDGASDRESADADADAEPAPAPAGAGDALAGVLASLNARWTYENFQLRCLKSEAAAMRAANHLHSAPRPSSTEQASPTPADGESAAERYAPNLAHVVRRVQSLVDDIIGDAVREAVARRDLLRAARQRRTRPTPSEAMIRRLAMAELGRAIHALCREACVEVLGSYAEVKRIAGTIVAKALVDRKEMARMPIIPAGTDPEAWTKQALRGLASVMGAVSRREGTVARFGSTSLFRDFSASYGPATHAAAAPTALRTHAALGAASLEGAPDSGAFAQSARREERFWADVQVSPLEVGGQGKAKGGGLQHKAASGDVTHVRPSYDCKYLAVGTSFGELLIWDFYASEQEPELVLFSGPDKGKGKGKQASSIVSLCWSYNSLQLGALCDDGSVRIYSLKPANKNIMPEKDGGKKGGDRGVEMLVSLSSAQVCRSTRALGAASNDPRAWAAGNRIACAFEPSFTLTGLYPNLAIPSANGDVTVIRLRTEGLLRAQDGEAQGDSGTTPDEATLDFLSTPMAAPPPGVKQAVYHGQRAAVVFACYRPDVRKLVTIDCGGTVCTWPADESERTGFGWFDPEASWAMPASIPSLVELGHSVVTDTRSDRKKKKKAKGEGEDEDGEGGDEGTRLEKSDGEIQTMQRWLVHYRQEGKGKKVQTIQTVIHKPKRRIKRVGVVYLSEYTMPGGDLRVRKRIEVSTRIPAHSPPPHSLAFPRDRLN